MPGNSCSAIAAPAYQCRDIPRLAARDTHYVDFADIIQSAASGCTFCGMVLSVFEKERTRKGLISIRTTDVPLALRFPDVYGYTPPELGTRYKGLFVNTEQGSGLIPKGGTISPSTGSNAAFKQFSMWAQACLNTHRTACHSMANKTGFRPTRVLDVRSDSAGGVFLREGRHEPPVVWACLSHCWGGHQPIKTTRSTIADHKQGISFHALPKTFQDAVAFTRRCNLQYLWIDSLCIIQDDEQDWLAEAAQMANIYRNSVITLSAAAGTGPHDGLYVRTKEEHTVVQKLPGLLGCPDVLVRSSPVEHRHTDHPLLRRGWVMQERLLSPRVLHFGVNELIWECMEQLNCECGGASTSYDWLERKTYAHPDAIATQSKLHMAIGWRKMVASFSELGLTNAGDLLPAISGTAKIFREGLEKKNIASRYLAGMWECWFLQDCLWTTYVLEGKSRPLPYRTPTYSWASVLRAESHRIRYRFEEYFTGELRGDEEDIAPKFITYHSKLLHARNVLSGPDEMGPMTYGYVVLEGPLMSAVLQQMDGRTWLLRIKQSPSIEEAKFFPDYNLSVPGEYEVEHGTRVFCLHLISLKTHEKQPVDKPPTHLHLWCLVLRKISDAGSSGDIQGRGSVYERIGLLHYKENAWRMLETWFNEEDVEQRALVKII